jgi:hypothetical protein
MPAGMRMKHAQAVPSAEKSVRMLPSRYGSRLLKIIEKCKMKSKKLTI